MSDWSDARLPLLLDRRRFLASIGVLGAAAAVLERPALAGPAGRGQLEPVVDALAAPLAALANDTIGGLVAFVVPGPDPWSVAQGVTTPELGGIAADGIGFMTNALDNFFPFPDQALTPIVRALADGLTDGAARFGFGLPPGLLDLPLELVRLIDDALSPILANDAAVPLSVVIAMILNGVATWVSPAALAGPFLTSPFANLTFEQKVEAFRRMEEDVVGVTGALDRQLTEPLRQSLSGLVAFVAGALLEFSAFGSYNEWSGGPISGGITERVPVGWETSGYLVATGHRPVEGWDELRGYYQGRRAAEA